MISPSLARPTAHAGNPVSVIFPTTNIVYAGRLVKTHDFSGATLIPLHKTSSHLPLHDSNQGLDDSQNEFESKTVIMTTSESSERKNQRETGREVEGTMGYHVLCKWFCQKICPSSGGQQCLKM